MLVRDALGDRDSLEGRVISMSTCAHSKAVLILQSNQRRGLLRQYTSIPWLAMDGDLHLSRGLPPLIRYPPFDTDIPMSFWDGLY